ncbi:MAG: hypothetical protein WC713_13490 [Candidatus Methylomirabilota bacterium]
MNAGKLLEMALISMAVGKAHEQTLRLLGLIRQETASILRARVGTGKNKDAATEQVGGQISSNSYRI